ncbi:MFS transporter [Shouchella clausii]|uniref:MFS transporter n=1 Tax=Shouchella clausii TaxID=79880 RepID=UPI000B966720|nr:MFS transporter [Shouchella clausii]AST97774.1 MFS transporter [Shouchella clausii]MEB5474217.1 MFS transporter [Shouchella clausii]QNM44213.1 MFS transporter [Shouchella clausii]WQG97098.1 MFS transporter [Shouchella clausii]
MRIKKFIKSWKYPSILLSSIGISSIGEWVYFIALNLIVLDRMGVMAVSGLYILRALSALFTTFWSGSLIDRLNKKHLIVWCAIFQAVFIAVLPSLSSLWAIYGIVFLINIASSMYEPTSMTYITKLIPQDQRKRFNSLRSFIDSGAFVIGPAIAGMLFMIGTPNFAIYMNAIALFLSALLTLFMPNIEKNDVIEAKEEKISLTVLKLDWQLVVDFSRKHVYIMVIYFLFSGVMVLATAIDSLEAAFSTKVLSLSERDYGLLVSIAGVGIIVGSFVNILIVKKVATSWLIGLGALMISIGYIIYAFSTIFLTAAIGFFTLSFSMAFMNTGFYTFYQNNVPVSVMGRVGSVYGFIEAFFIIIGTIMFGIMAEFISIRFVLVCGSLLMFVVTIILFICNTQPSKAAYYSEEHGLQASDTNERTAT